ncbi:hypothetical protein ACH5RR_023621 [Cinchona calisaya]|uniref:Uncharacterized protein n=1 Tax=Cinchona calisaya TaxID=153742 RepID=A0ABD2ZB71_9GENT
MRHMRKAKAEAKEEEKEEKELSKTRVQIAKDVRLAREAEATMDLHGNKAVEKVAHQEAKYAEHSNSEHFLTDSIKDSYGSTLCNDGHSTDQQIYRENLQRWPVH